MGTRISGYLHGWAGTRSHCPKKWGGLGLKDLPLFAQALAAKMGWTLLTRQNLWTSISYHKCIWPLNIMEWTRLPNWPKSGISSVWKALLHSFPLIRQNLVWRINDGSLARIGLDPWNGSNGRHLLSRKLIQHLHSHEIKVLANIADTLNSTIFAQGWKSTQQINLPQCWYQEWNDYITALSESHIRIKEGPNELMCHQSDSGLYTPKSGYQALISHKVPDLITYWWKAILKLTAPPRIKLFFWCILKDKVPTGENLMHRASHGPTWCTLCKNAIESTTHLFLKCTTLMDLWQKISTSISFTGSWEGVDLNRAWKSWYHWHKGSKLQSLPLIISWYIWLARNPNIFESKPVS